MPRYDRKKKRWVVQIRMPGGKRPTAYFREEKAAWEYHRKQKDIKERVARGLLAPLEEVLLVDATIAFLQRREKTKIAATFEPEPARMAWWIKKLTPEVPLDTVQPYQIEDAALELVHDEGAAPATANRYLTLLSQFFKFAQQRNWVSTNPVAGVKRFSEKRQVRPHAYWEDPEHLERYLAEAESRGPMVFALCNFLGWTGVRSCEVLGAHWGDWQGDTFRLQRIFDKKTATIQHRLKGLKEGGSFEIPIVPRLRAALIAWRSASQFNRPADPIFCNRRGDYLRHNWVYRLQLDIARTAGLPRVTLHGLRHSFSRFAEKQGFLPREQQALLGHTTLQTTQKYSGVEAKHLVKRAAELGWGALPDGKPLVGVVKGGDDDA